MAGTRWRITYAADGPLRYVSHLEQVRVWERAIRQAGPPLAYSLPCPLPLGFAYEAEWLDPWPEEPVELGTIASALVAVLPKGLTIWKVEKVPQYAPSLPSRVWAAEYMVTVETAVPRMKSSGG